MLLENDLANKLAREWIAAWNSANLDRVLKLYAEDCEMSSAGIIGLGFSKDGVLRGKESVRAYWRDALSKSPDLQFDLKNVFASPDSVAIHYYSSRGHDVLEYLRINSDGLIVQGSANHPVARSG